MAGLLYYVIGDVYEYESKNHCTEFFDYCRYYGNGVGANGMAMGHCVVDCHGFIIFYLVSGNKIIDIKVDILK